MTGTPAPLFIQKWLIRKLRTSGRIGYVEVMRSLSASHSVPIGRAHAYLTDMLTRLGPRISMDYGSRILSYKPPPQLDDYGMQVLELLRTKLSGTKIETDRPTDNNGLVAVLHHPGGAARLNLVTSGDEDNGHETTIDVWVRDKSEHCGLTHTHLYDLDEIHDTIREIVSGKVVVSWLTSKVNGHCVACRLDRVENDALADLLACRDRYTSDPVTAYIWSWPSGVEAKETA